MPFVYPYQFSAVDGAVVDAMFDMPQQGPWIFCCPNYSTNFDYIASSYLIRELQPCNAK